jgi:predicted DNA-binding protein YlxM (UPF0122 family)
MMNFCENEVIKQALREAIQRRQADMERFSAELERIEKKERESEEAMMRQMQEIR